MYYDSRVPVLGHAFVGWGTALAVPPRKNATRHRQGLGAALWVPIVVGFAYLPDIVGQLGRLGGYIEARELGHSVLFAVAASLVLSPVLAILTPLPLGRAFAIVLGSVLVHDVLDLLQSTDRMPWWPFSDQRVILGEGLLPTRPRRELALFGGAFGLFVAAWRLSGRGGSSLGAWLLGGSGRLAWVNHAVLATTMLAAAGVHALRGVREDQYEEAMSSIKRQRYAAALEMLDSAGRWPSTARAGRIDYQKAEAFNGLGDRSRAEEHYLMAYQADPTFFWTLADLAVFYASSDEPVLNRRLRVAPLVNVLKSEFAHHKDLPRVLARIERKLAKP